MKLPYRTHARRVLAILFLLLVAGWALPQFFSAERYRRRVESGLERALGRSVTFGAISFHLLPRPGFTVENAVIGEDPAFGAEPFARVDRLDCDLQWRSLLRGRLEISRLSLERPSFNLVRNSSGNWNIESLLGASDAGGGAARAASPGHLHVEAEEARIDFKLVQDKKPFAITEVSGRLDFERGQRITYHWAGSPIRTDFSLPTPGEFHLDGQWTPGAGPEGTFDATLRTQGSMLYDWIPVLSGRNPGIYGVVDASVHLTGSLRALAVEGQVGLSQLHRWDQPPPSGGLNTEIHFRAGYNRAGGRLMLESLDGSFADSHLHITGSVDSLFSSPELDLVVAVERSRLEDFHAMAARFMPRLGDWKVSGRADALMTIQGPWQERRYGGFVDIRNVRLTTPAGTYPVSEITLRINPEGARLAPVHVSLAPHVELLAQGTVRRLRHSRQQAAAPQFQYELELSATAVPLHDLLRFARGVGVKSAEGLDARGTASATLRLTGLAWPLARPAITGHADLDAARLLIPGLTEPLNLPKAHLQVRNGIIRANPLVAVIGTSVFKGSLEHQGGQAAPWKFDLRASSLSIQQGALWFDVLGNRAPLPLLERLPGLRSLVERRTRASSLFSALNAQGTFSSPLVTYRALELRDFQAHVRVSGRVVRLSRATFRAGGGRGKGTMTVDLTRSPAQLMADAALDDAHLQPLAPFLPEAVQKLRGTYSMMGHFESLGLSRQEVSSNLQGQATVRLKNVSLGTFDPLRSLARASGEGMFEPVHGEASFRSAAVTLQVNNRHVTITSSPVDFSGARIKLTGTYSFAGAVNLNVFADLRGLTRAWLPAEASASPGRPSLRLHLTGSFEKLTLEPAQELSRVSP
jgi:AsmA family/AsmA-like C-terminal region